jgi:hypothetical protein
LCLQWKPLEVLEGCLNSGDRPRLSGH